MHQQALAPFKPDDHVIAGYAHAATSGRAGQPIDPAC
jgi:hypothetical protein